MKPMLLHLGTLRRDESYRNEDKDYNSSCKDKENILKLLGINTSIGKDDNSQEITKTKRITATLVKKV